MRRLISILVPAILLCIATRAKAQDQPKGVPSSATTQNTSASASSPTNIDGIAARIGNDVLTESQVRELGDYQKLVDGKAQARDKILDELVNQWVVATDAMATKFPHPTAADVTLEFQTLLKQFPSPAQFQTRLAQVGLTPDQVRQVISDQLYYVRFLDYKFHAVTQVTASEIQSYYQQDFLPQLKKRGLSVPPLAEVEAQIRQLVTQEDINEKAAQWLEQAKSRLRIVIQPVGGGG